MCVYVGRYLVGRVPLLDSIIERRYADIEGAEIREGGGALSFRGHAPVSGGLTDLGPFRGREPPCVKRGSCGEQVRARLLPLAQ
jgi:hypothetical protein